MSNNNWENDDDLDNYLEVNNDETNGIKDLRRAKKADEKRIKEPTERLEKFERQEREGTVAKVLESKGVNSKAARLILKDLDEVNEESVNTWLDDNGDLFGLSKPEVTEEQQVNRAALRQQDVVTQLGTTPDRAEDLLSRINNAASAEELNSIIYSQQ